MVESTDICTCKILNTREKFIDFIDIFEGKTDDQLKAIYFETKEFNKAYFQQQAMQSHCKVHDVIYTAPMFNKPALYMTPFEAHAWEIYSEHIDQLRKAW